MMIPLLPDSIRGTAASASPFAILDPSAQEGILSDHLHMESCLARETFYVQKSVWNGLYGTFSVEIMGGSTSDMSIK